MNNIVILIIDDDPVIQKLLEKHLELSGFATLHALSGGEAMKFVDDNQIDLIILDINMPQMDGFQTLTKLRKKTGGSTIPVIFLSCLDRDHLKIKGLELGADDYMVKPFNGAELTARIKAVLRRRGSFRPQQGEVTGDIGVLGLADLLQMLSLSQKDGTITFPDMQGALAVRSGEVVAVRQGKFFGMEAMLRLFLLESGPFILNYTQLPEKLDGPGREIGYLLLEVTTRIDEIKEAMQLIGGQETMLHLQDQSSGIPQLEVLRDSFPLSLIELLTQLEVNIEEGLKRIKRTVDQGVISVEQGE